MKRTLSTILAAMSLLAGSAHAAPQREAEAAATKPAAGRALLYVYRPQTLIGIANFDVPIIHLDNQRLGRIRIGGHMAIPVSPGRHTLTTTESLLGNDTGRIRGETRFSIAAGSTLYLRYTESFKSFTAVPLPSGTVVESSGDYRFEAVRDPEARAEIADTKPLELERTGR